MPKISLQATEKSLFEDTANKAQDAESPPVFAFLWMRFRHERQQIPVISLQNRETHWSVVSSELRHQPRSASQLKYHDNRAPDALIGRWSVAHGLHR
jgi:hypothetical protein